MAAGVAVASILSFLPSLSNDFVNFDDRLNLVANPNYRGFGPAELRWMLTTFHLGHWQPLAWLSFALDYQLWGMNPARYHLTSLLLHAANAAMLLLLGERLLQRAGLGASAALAGATIGALFWAVHPLRVESVVWATERRDVLCGTFMLLALLLYVDAEGRPRRLGGAILAAALAATAKASAMALPLLLLILDVYPLRRLGGESGWTGTRAWRVYREKLPFLVVAAVTGVVALAAQRSAGALAPLAELPVTQRLAAAMYGLGFYLWKTAAPFGLLPLYEYPRSFGPLHPMALVGAAVTAAAAGVAVAMRRRCPAVLAALAAYAVALGPTLGAAQSGLQLVADRYSYFASLGLSVLFGGVVASAARTPSRAARIAPLLIILAALTLRQSTAWHDSLTLWTRALATAPDNAFVHAQLGEVALQAGDADIAERRYRQAVALRPDVASLHHGLAAVFAARRMFEDAVAENQEAIRLQPRFPAPWASLGVAFANLRRDDEAMAAYRQALLLDPARADVRANLAELLGDAGRTDEALSEYREALRIEPSAVAFNNLGRLYMRIGKAPEATMAYREALRLRPDAAPIHENLGYALATLGDRAAALREFEEASRLDPRAEGARRAIADLQGTHP